MALGHPRVTAGLAISGVYDLAPIRDTALNNALKLTDREVARLSPLRLPAVHKRLDIAYGTAELPALVFDSIQLHESRIAATRAGRAFPDRRGRPFQHPQRAAASRRRARRYRPKARRLGRRRLVIPVANGDHQHICASLWQVWRLDRGDGYRRGSHYDCRRSGPPQHPPVISSPQGEHLEPQVGHVANTARRHQER